MFPMVPDAERSHIPHIPHTSLRTLLVPGYKSRENDALKQTKAFAFLI